MDQSAPEQAASFVGLHADFAPLFWVHDNAGHSEQYLSGLLLRQTDRLAVENVGEPHEGARPLLGIITRELAGLNSHILVSLPYL